MIHKDTKRCVLLCNKFSFNVIKGKFKGICQSLFLLRTCHEKISITTENEYVWKKIISIKFILNLLLIQRIQSVCELVLGIEEGSRTILWCTGVCCWSAGSSERVSMSILSVVLQILGSDFALRSVVHGKCFVLLDCRHCVSRCVQVFLGDVTYSSCAGVVCV